MRALHSLNGGRGSVSAQLSCAVTQLLARVIDSECAPKLRMTSGSTSSTSTAHEIHALTSDTAEYMLGCVLLLLCKTVVGAAGNGFSCPK